MEGYGPVGVAKASLEAIVRQIGWELGSRGITANTIQAGITPTRALTKIIRNFGPKNVKIRAILAIYRPLDFPNDLGDSNTWR